MNKSKILLFVFIIQALTFVMCLFIQIKGVWLKNIWFSLAIFEIGVYALVYALLYIQDSCTYLGFLLIAFSLATAYKFLNGYSFQNYFLVYLLCFAFAHMSVFVIFRQNIHFKIFAIIILEVILLLSNKLNIVPAWLWWLINGTFLLALFINAFQRARKNFKEN